MKLGTKKPKIYKSCTLLLLIITMQLFFLTATTFGFAFSASPSSNSNSFNGVTLQNQQQGGRFNVQPPPSSAAKIKSHRSYIAPSSPTSTSTHTITPSTTALAAENSNITPASTGGVSLAEAVSPRGEHQSNIFSRLLYIYASQLLDISSKRQLQVTDALPMPGHVGMDEQVPALKTAYDRCKAKAQKHLETLKSSSSSPSPSSTPLAKQQNKHKSKIKQKIDNRIAKSQSMILIKALLLHQKKNLAITGILRLCNTLLQAFPAILVSRLLRFIESGDLHHPSKPVYAALQLLGLLSAKMIVENLYFHNVVKCATMVRGSLTGLIFDKSLRLSSSSSSSSNRNVNTNENEDEASSSAEKNKKAKKQKQSLGTGGVLNLMQTDVSVIESTALQIHTIWDGLLQICIYSSLLYKYLGSSVFYGIAVLLLTIPTNSFTLRVLNKLGKKEFEAKDARTKKTSEAVSNMKLLKLQGWEHHFRRGIESQRKEELMRHINRGAFRALNNAISNAVPAIVLVVTLTAYRRTGKPIVASTIFTAISLFNQLRFPLLFYPMVIDSLANGKNSIARLSTYLSQEELTPYVQKITKVNGEGGRIELANGNFLWSPTSKTDGDSKSIVAAPALCNAELKVNSGEIVAVVGPVGSGKSALVKALLGELEPVPRMMVDQNLSVVDSADNDIPIVKTTGGVAYCAQESWLSKGTIRDAVVFGRKFDEKRYLNAIFDSGLDEDFTREALSSNTQVGEGGSSLSGGQRARVQLARALYDEDVGVYLLDDPLSALDAAVGATVFERITRRMKERKAATVLVTNDISLPRRCDRVILMGSSGTQSCSKIIDIGSYDELIKRGHDLKTVSDEEFDFKPSKANNTDISHSMTEHADVERELDFEHKIECNAESDSHHASTHIFHFKNNTVGQEASSDSNDKNKKNIDAHTQKNVQVQTVDEKMSTGAVPRETYMTYLKSIRNPLLIFITLGCFLTANGAQFFQQYTVAKWTELSHTSSLSAALSGVYLQSLVRAAGVVSLFLWLRSYLLMRAGTRASEFLHDKMLHSVFNAPSTFFDSTPSGQILSRFGKELETVDRSVPDGIGGVLFCFLQIAITVLGLAGVVTPKMLFPVVFIGVFYKSIMTRFRPAARDLKRCESKTRSPIYTHFSETLRGAETIRSFAYSPSLWSSNMRSLVDENLSVFYSVKCLDRWLSIRLETLGNIVVLLSAFASIVLTRNGQLKSGSAGWGLTQSLAITGLLTWAVRVLTDLESQMMSVMRVTELTNLESSTLTEKKLPMTIPQERESPGEALTLLFQGNDTLPKSPSGDHTLVQSGWPWKGDVSFRNVSMRYNDASPLALSHISLDIPSGTTLGVVGRTGSGKSSLLLTLFRLIEIEDGGEILIDGIDIRSIGLHTLRRSLAIIPQDPTLFSGTLMYNLDATGTATHEDAWIALEAASADLANDFKTSGGLDTIIEEGGKNYSAGQRQLICLARALLRRSKLLVLDEATSSVDPNTDAQVQATIRREFVNKGVSVITVAHRLDTVMGSDKIAVLGDGKLLEYGKPEDLLKDIDGHLKRLVDADTDNKRKGASNQNESMVSIASE